MTKMSIQRVQCKKCKAVYERPMLYSISFFGNEEWDRKNRKILGDTGKKCPKCGGDDIARAKILERILVIFHIKKLEGRYKRFEDE